MDNKKTIIEFLEEYKLNIESISFEILCETTYCYKIKLIGNIKFKNVIISTEDKHISYTYTKNSVILNIGLDSKSYETYITSTISYLKELLITFNKKHRLIPSI